MSTMKLAPTVDVKVQSTEGKLSGGEVTFEAGKDSIFSSSYSGVERVLQVTHFGRRVRWNTAMPRGETLTGDFLSGNLYLFVDCCWPTLPANGHIRIEPKDIRFFDAERRPLGKKQSLVMHYLLRQRMTELAHTHAIHADFVFHREGAEHA